MSTKGNQSTNSASTKIEQGIGGTGTGTGTGTDITNSGKSDLKNNKSNLVDQGSPNEVLISVEKTDKGSNKKTTKKKTYSNKNKNGSEEVVSDIADTITAISTVSSLKFGEHWLITKEESMTMAKPLKNILDKYNVLDKVSGCSDGIALIVATSSVFIPRVMIHGQVSKNKKQKQIDIIKKNGGMKNEQIRQDEKNISTGLGTIETGIKSDDGQSIKSIHTSISGQY